MPSAVVIDLEVALGESENRSTGCIASLWWGIDGYKEQVPKKQRIRTDIKEQVLAPKLYYKEVAMR
jgi:hypothetical protein